MRREESLTRRRRRGELKEREGEVEWKSEAGLMGVVYATSH
jgi:hypothetical protein